jgi:hypothetical protein
MYQVIWMYDGCPSNPVTPKVFTDVEAAKAFIRDYTQNHWEHFKMYPKTSIDILDVHAQRLISYVL